MRVLFNQLPLLFVSLGCRCTCWPLDSVLGPVLMPCFKHHPACVLNVLVYFCWIRLTCPLFFRSMCERERLVIGEFGRIYSLAGSRVTFTENTKPGKMFTNPYYELFNAISDL